jgi:predicted P-loop ATPase
MVVLFDKKLIISTAGTRKAARWQPQNIFWSEFIEKVSRPVRSTETLAEYLSFPKSVQDDLKDVGGFVGGVLRDNIRKAQNVVGRDLVTLDLDNIPVGGTQDVLEKIATLPCAYVLYSTRKHSEENPRIRLCIPLSRTATAEEYEPIARKIGEWIGTELCDPTTFQASRLMYYPSCCKDSSFVYHYSDKTFVDVDGVLAMYPNWKSISDWAGTPKKEALPVRTSTRQADPTTKGGVVGAFCKAYNIYDAIAKYIPEIYSPCDVPDRLTFNGGSTTGGAVVYDNATFLFSYHATDPTSMKLVNAFDMIRLHLFGDLDDNAALDTPQNRLPSYQEMIKLATSDPAVTAFLDQSRIEAITREFGGTELDVSWVSKLMVSAESRRPLKNLRNIEIMLENDPLLKGRIRYNEFLDTITGIAPMPWEGRKDVVEDGESDNVFHWTDFDSMGLRMYSEKILGFQNKDLIEVVIATCAKKHSYNPVIDYLNSLRWDGKPRLDEMFVKYFNAVNDDYTRAVTRKCMVAAVARAMKPGTKFDNITILVGSSGIGKSTFFKKLGGEWFSDSVAIVEGKDGMESIQYSWIIELGEMDAYLKAGKNSAIAFLSKVEDRYRPAYGRHTVIRPRRCVFFGSTNQTDFLRAHAGNRRFWIVQCQKDKYQFDLSTLTQSEIDQIWAEAVAKWQEGETLYLNAKMTQRAEIIQSSYIEEDELDGVIQNYLDTLVPENWDRMELSERLTFLNGAMIGAVGTKLQDRVCIMQVWQECLGKTDKLIDKRHTNRISASLERLQGWEKTSTIRFGIYGRQRGFMRKIMSND